MLYLKSKNSKSFQPNRIFKKLYGIIKACNSYYSPTNYKYYLFLISYLRLYVKEGFTTHQVFQLGLGSSFPSSEKINKYIGQYKLLNIIRTLDPEPWWPIYDKGKFYTICMNMNMPIPKLYANVFKHYKSVSFIDSNFVKRDELIKFIREKLPGEFVIKPCMGERGLFLNIYTKTSTGIINQLGNSISEQEIYDSMMNHKRFDSFIVQERLKNHPYFLKVHPSDYLHTIRIITFINPAGKFEILHTHIDLATGKNFASQKGDLRIKIAKNDGVLEYGILLDKCYGGFKKVYEHPESGKNFRDFKLPLWNEILSLSNEAALNFLPWRTLGWDFAITEEGVKILEANIGYSAPNIFGEIDKILKALQNG